MANKSTFKNKLTALAVGAPLVTIGFVGLAAPASASASVEDTGGDYRTLAADAVAVVEANTDTTVYAERSSDSTALETLTTGNTILALDSGVDGFVAVLTGNVEGGGQIGYVSASAVDVVEQLDGDGIDTGNLDTEGDTGAPESSGEVGDDGVVVQDGVDVQEGEVADSDGMIEDEWDDFEPGEEGPLTDEDGNVIVDEGDVIVEDGATIDDGMDWDEREDGSFVEVDENAGDPADIESGFVGGDMSNPASLAAMGGLGLVLIAGGAYAMARKTDLVGAKQDN